MNEDVSLRTVRIPHEPNMCRHHNQFQSGKTARCVGAVRNDEVRSSLAFPMRHGDTGGAARWSQRKTRQSSVIGLRDVPIFEVKGNRGRCG